MQPNQGADESKAQSHATVCFGSGLVVELDKEFENLLLHTLRNAQAGVTYADHRFAILS